MTNVITSNASTGERCHFLISEISGLSIGGFAAPRYRPPRSVGLAIIHFSENLLTEMCRVGTILDPS